MHPLDLLDLSYPLHQLDPSYQLPLLHPRGLLVDQWDQLHPSHQKNQLRL
jgi:hypothetical protein